MREGLIEPPKTIKTVADIVGYIKKRPGEIIKEIPHMVMIIL